MTADEWNRQFPRGTAVKYWPQGKGKDQRAKPRPCVDARTRGRAYYLSTGTMVVPLEGHGAQPLPRIAINEVKSAPAPVEAGV
jgi:hypothetical protein